MFYYVERRPSALKLSSAIEKFLFHRCPEKAAQWGFSEEKRQSGGSSEENTPPSVLDSSSKPETKRNPRISKKDRSISTESSVYHTALTFKASWKEYCNSTAIHGVRYFVEEGRTTFERIFWVLALAASLAGCFYLIMKVYTKWDSSPVIVSFAETSTPIWMVPFPAVSVCPETKSRQTQFNFTDVFHRHNDYLMAQMNPNATNATDMSDIDPDETLKLESISLICDQHVLTQGNKTISQEDMEYLRVVAPPIDEVLFVCMWEGEVMPNCSGKAGDPLFTPFMSDEGLCYTFNMLSNQELFTPLAVQYDETQSRESQGWNLEDGYPNNASLNTFPRRALGQGAKSGLFILLRAYTQDCDYLCRGPVQGFKVLLHNPAEIPRIGQQYFRAPLNQEVVVVVKPSMMTTSEGLREYEPSRRQCYFPYERHLRYFQVYTQKNCELECSTNYTMRMCNCTAFYMPRSNDIPICGSGSSNCLKNATEGLVLHEIEKELERQKGKTSSDDCHCLPACTSLEYDAQTSQADFDWENVFQAYRTPVNELGEGLALARVSIYFKDTQFITSRRSELYGQTDFLANCGGLLGLFSGFSLISLIEILYYLSIRLWCNVHRAHQRRARALAELTALGNLAITGPFDVEKQPPQPSAPEEPFKS
ncbi:Pickpocket protein 28 [Frankliniella fusca]|uniref:Pickpocket protein 28 n=1 Tax=Frankliniella fusca TaxID=407009 RepID=A0AAE1GZ79_9NEOP|nr:Pickpocket protein 28 [Frankliniella fusca]